MLVGVTGPKSNTLVGDRVGRVVGELLVVDSNSSMEVVGSSGSSSTLGVEDGMGVEDLVEGVLVDLVVEDLVGVEEKIGGSLESTEPAFWQSLLLSLHSNPKSQHKPDRQTGPPLQDPPLHMG